MDGLNDARIGNPAHEIRLTCIYFRDAGVCARCDSSENDEFSIKRFSECMYFGDAWNACTIQPSDTLNSKRDLRNMESIGD
ncbi:hypothetical protein M6B38_345725 [Iris pallida]|uniref:Uncharacterized protein n=1 Tax=Iris pallida TaxID=29817 RepID=A0AAX6GUC6_IRIPA|nr:hypothetical protein M6B38_345725 [Iris pallida]